MSSDEPPIGWQVCRLGDLGQWTSGGTPSRAHPEYYGGGVPWVKTGELPDGPVKQIEESITELGLKSSSAKRLPIGTLLIAMYGATIGKLGILTCEAATNQACAALLPTGTTGTVVPFVFHFLLSQREELRRIGQGGAQPNISQALIKEFEIPTPPLAEQRRIVAKLDALQSRSRRAKEALDAIPPLLERFRQSVLAAAFRGDLTAEWRAKNPDVEPASELLKRIRTERRRRWEEAELAKLKAKGRTPGDDRWKVKYEEPEPVETGGLPPLPDGWAWASVAQLSTKVVDGVHKKPNYVPAGIPFLTVKNLTAGPGISFRDVNYITADDHAEYWKRTDPEMGDILVSKDGTLGVIRLIRTPETFGIFVTLALIKPVVREMGEYLELALSSPIFQERFKATGTGLLHIHLVDLRSAALPIAPIAEQEILRTKAQALLAQMEEIEVACSSGLAQLGSLDSAILAKAFRGELVPQDPTDEPASALLARIAAERSGPSTPNTPSPTTDSAPSRTPARRPRRPARAKA